MGIFNEFVNLFFLWRARNSRDSSFSRGVSLSGGFGVMGWEFLFLGMGELGIFFCLGAIYYWGRRYFANLYL